MADAGEVDDDKLDFDRWIDKYAHQRGQKPFYAYYTSEERKQFFVSLIQLLEESSPEADRRRRKTASIVGISCPKALERLQKQHPFMLKYFPRQSKTSLAHLFPPPHLRRKTAASLYRSLIDARPAGGENDYHEEHPLVPFSLSFSNSSLPQTSLASLGSH